MNLNTFARLSLLGAVLAGAVGLVSAPAIAHESDKFTLSSPDVMAGGKIDNKFVLNGFGCEGGNISPALAWKNAPAGTRSFTLQVYDPDAPSGSGWCRIPTWIGSS